MANCFVWRDCGTVSIGLIREANVAVDVKLSFDKQKLEDFAVTASDAVQAVQRLIDEFDIHGGWGMFSLPLYTIECTDIENIEVGKLKCAVVRLKECAKVRIFFSRLPPGSKNGPTTCKFVSN